MYIYIFIFLGSSVFTYITFTQIEIGDLKSGEGTNDRYYKIF